MHNHCYENEFYLHVYCLANQTRFHNKGCATGLVLKLRQKATRKWTIEQSLPTSLPGGGGAPMGKGRGFSSGNSN